MLFKDISARILATTLLTSVYSISFSQIQTIGLKQAVESAVINYPGLKAKQMQIQSADYAISDAKHAGLPSVKISDQIDLSAANSLPGSYFPMGIVPSTSGGIRTTNKPDIASGNIGIGYTEYELATFGLNSARVESAKSFKKEADADFKKSEYWLQYRVTQLYFDMLKYNLLSTIQQKNIDRYRVLYNNIKAYTNSGMKAGVDSSVANAEVSKAKIQQIKTLEVLNRLKSEFVFYTGFKNSAFNIDTSFYHMNGNAISQLQVLVSADSVGLNNPVLNYFRSKWDYSLAQEKLIKRSFLPKLNFVGAAWTRGSSISPKDVYGSISSGLDYSRFNYMMGLSLTYNLVDMVHRRDKSTVQYFQSESRKAELSEQESLLNNQLNQSDIAIRASLEKIREIPFQLRASRDAYAQKLALYNSGLVNIAELTNVSYLLYSAETDEVEARSELLNTLLQKAVTNNTLNSFISHF